MENKRRIVPKTNSAHRLIGSKKEANPHNFGRLLPNIILMADQQAIIIDSDIGFGTRFTIKLSNL